MDRHALAVRLVKHEDERLTVYRCPAGKLTIGVGRNLEDRGISREESRFLLANDIDACLVDLEPLPWFQHLSDLRQQVICEMRFNLGMGGLMKFRKMLVHLEHGRYTSAAREMLDSDWARQVGGRADHLAVMMITDEEPS